VFSNNLFIDKTTLKTKTLVVDVYTYMYMFVLDSDSESGSNVYYIRIKILGMPNLTICP
jgi:hypothetical protein